MNKATIKNNTFIFRYDPHSSFEGIFTSFWDAVDNKITSVESNIIRSSSIESLSTNMNKNRLRLFAILVEKQPINLTELARLLRKDYTLVRRDARILEGMGLIKLEKQVRGNLHDVKPIALYKRVVFDFPMFDLAIADENNDNLSAVSV